MKNEKKIKDDLLGSIIGGIILLIALKFINLIPWSWLQSGIKIGLVYITIDIICLLWKFYRFKKTSKSGLVNNKTE